MPTGLAAVCAAVLGKGKEEKMRRYRSYRGRRSGRGRVRMRRRRSFGSRRRGRAGLRPLRVGYRM